MAILQNHSMPFYAEVYFEIDPFLGKLMILRNNFISKCPLTMSNISYWHRYSYVVLYSKEIYESLAMTHKVHELRLKIQIIAYKSE